MLLACIAFAKHPVREEIIEEIRLKAKSWIPMSIQENSLIDIPEELMHMKLGIMGSNSYSTPNFVMENASELIYTIISDIIDFVPNMKKFLGLTKSVPLKGSNTTLPDAFDAREKWPPCIHGVRDQQLCGSCWAFASAGFLSDRFCIQSEGDINVVLAPQDLVACNFENFGCSGGMLVNTIDYLMKEGIVSESCMPYQDGDSFCEFKCINKTEKWTKYYCKQHSMQILSDHVAIQTELMTNGPMMVGLTVYEDFMNYKSGIYKYTTG